MQIESHSDVNYREVFFDTEEAWHKWRSSKIGASDISFVMKASPYKSRANLLLEKKTGKSKDEPPAFILEKGHKFEAAMRPKAELLLNSNFPAVYLEHKQFDYLSASLDGFDKKQNIIWECKLVGKDVYDEIIKTGKPPKKYKYQIQQQLFISGGRYCILWFGTGEDNYNHIIVYPETELQSELLKEAKLFYEEWQEKDIVPPQFDSILVQYLQYEAEYKKAKKIFDQFKDVLKGFDYNKSYEFNDIYYEKRVSKRKMFDKEKLKQDLGDISKYEYEAEVVSYSVKEKKK